MQIAPEHDDMSSVEVLPRKLPEVDSPISVSPVNAPLTRFRVCMEAVRAGTATTGFAVSNGRLEARQVEIATKLAGRIEAVLHRP